MHGAYAMLWWLTAFKMVTQNFNYDLWSWGGGGWIPVAKNGNTCPWTQKLFLLSWFNHTCIAVLQGKLHTISLVYLNLVIARVKYPRSEVTYSSRIDLNSTQLGEEGDPALPSLLWSSLHKSHPFLLLSALTLVRPSAGLIQPTNLAEH